ncbi:MAG: hypothetical protein GXO75_01735, partial [Calditrichaeota bacterium]|nr:hypothetical protein [Calditrichota bacterium]
KSASGYLIYLYSGSIRLYQIQNGSATTTKYDEKSTALSVSPGDDFQVKWDASAWEFTVYVNGASAGTLTDAGHTVDLTTAYAGVMLYGGDSYNNDIEEFTSEYVSQSSDTTPPDAVTNLAASAASSSSISLSWTATGDDGATGTASAYDIRYSTSSITSDTDFDNATAVTGEPTPSASGSAESMTVSGLSASTLYHFAMKVRDEANNWSSLSNDASATTDAGSGGGSATYSCQLDDFDRVDIGSNWSVTAEHFIESGELALQTTASGWSYLAVYQKPGAVAAKLQWSATNSAPLSGYIPGGLAILLDNSDPASANGYFLYRKETLDVYEIVNGALGNKIQGANVSQAAPAPGDIIKAEITDDATGTQKEVKFYVNDQLDATFTLSNASDLANLYVGTFQWGGGVTYDNVNNIDNFWACYPGATNNPQNILKISGDLQAGQPNTQLPEPIKVQVTDANDTGVQGVLLDFQVMQGDATLPDIDNFVFDGNIWKEVESGRLYETSTIEQSPDASNGEYVTYTWVTGLRGKKLVEVPFFTPDSGAYDIYLRVFSPDGSHNTAYVGIDNADSVRFDVDANNQGSWAWIPVINNAVIDNGSHVMKIFAYESPFNFDKFLIQKDGGSAPSGMGGEGPDFPNVTDSLGFAQTHVQLGTDASQNIIIHVTGEKNDGTSLTGSPVEFTEKIESTDAYKIGNNETLEEHPTKTLNLQVTVWDKFDNAVPNKTVSWAIAQGAGQLSASSSVTNSQGVAVVGLTLDATASGQVIVQATANKSDGTPLIGSPVTKTVNVLNPASSLQRVSPAGDVTGQAGSVLPFDDSPTVKVLAQDNTPFQGYPVEFAVTAGNGAVGTTTTPTEQTVIINTDANGEAKARWKLGDLDTNKVEARTPDLTGSPIVFNANAIQGDPAHLVKLSGDGQNGAVGLPTNEPFVAQVTDANDFSVPGRDVKFTITDPTDAYFGTLGNRDTTLTTDPEGKVSVTMTYGSELNKVHTVTAEVVGTTVPSEEFTATPTVRVAKSIVYVSGRGQSAEVTTTLDNAFFVKALDPFGNPVENQSVVFKVVAGNGNIGGLPEVTKTTNADGLASATLTLGTLAGDSVHVVEASAIRTDGTGDALEGSPVTFKATGLPKAAEKLVKDIASDGKTQQVGVALQKPIRVRVTDTFGNGVKGHVVNFVVQPGNGKLLDDMGEGTSKDVVTADSGYATINWIMPESPPGNVFLQASGKKPNGAALQDSPMQFTATAVVGPADSMVAITPDTTLKGTVGKLLSQKVEVKIVDRFGNLVPNIPVTFNITAGGGTVNGAANVTLPTGDDGHAAVDWTLGTVSGTENNLVEVTSSVPNNPLLTFKASAKPDIADSMKPDLTHDPFGRVGKMLATGPMKVTIVDKYGNPVPDQPVTFTVQDVNGNKGYLEVEGQITQLIKSDADGIATVNWYLGPQPGSENNKLVASSKRNNVDLVNSPHTFTVSAVTDSAYKVFSVTDSTTQLEANLGATVQLKVKVTDRFNNPVGNYKVKFEVLSHETANGGSLDAPEGDVTMKEKTTDSNGIASVNFTLGNKGGVNINQVRVSAMKNEIEHLVGSPMVFYVTGKVTDATQMNDFRGDHQEGTVDEFLPTELEVAAQDNFGNNVGGQSIKFRILPVQGLADSLIGALGDGTARDTSVITNPTTGIAKIKWRLGKKTGQYQVEVTSKNGSDDLDRSGFKFTATAHAGKTNAMASSIQAFPAEAVVSDGANKLTIVVTLHDKFGNPVDGKAVTLAATGEGNTVEQPMSVSDATGQVTGKISSRIAEAKMVSAHDINSNVEIGDSVTVRFTPDMASAINKAPQPNGDAQVRNVGTVLPESLKVSITDKFGNRIANYPVRFSVTYGGGQILETQPVVTDSAGIAFSRLRLGTQAGVNTVEARANGLNNSPGRFTETGLAPTQPFNFVKIGGDNQTANAGQKLPEPLCVQLVDANGWPVWGQNVLYEIKLNDGDIVSNNPVKTDEYGKSCAEIVAGKDAQTLNIITASLTQYPSVSTTFYETSISINATTIIYVSGSGDSAIVAQPLIVCCQSDG